MSPSRTIPAATRSICRGSPTDLRVSFEERSRRNVRKGFAQRGSGLAISNAKSLQRRKEHLIFIIAKCRAGDKSYGARSKHPRGCIAGDFEIRTIKVASIDCGMKHLRQAKVELATKAIAAKE